LTIEAFFAHAAGDIDLELYDAQGTLLAASRSTASNERIDAAVAAGQTLTLKVLGANADVDFRLANLLRVSGGVIDVFGASGDDRFAFVADSRHTITVNGVRYKFGAEEIHTIRIRGSRGADAVTLTGSAGD
jgi:hypothetical protein